MAQVLKEEVQRRIDDAALEVFAEKGYLSATIGEIASRANISTGNIYRYYDSKEALFNDVIDDAFVDRFKALLNERVTSLSRQAGGAGAPEDAYQLASEELLRFTIDHRLRMIILLGRAEGTRLETFATETMRELIRLAMAYVEANEPTFEIVPTLSFTLERIYRSLIDTNVMILATHHDEASIREAYESWSRYHLAGMRALFHAK